jgi:hypothetical protein
METEIGFDVEGFGKIVALFDSDKVGEAQNAFTKAVLLCRKHGLRFADAAGMAFGNADAVRQQLESQFNAEVERMKQAAMKLRQENDDLRAQLEEEDGDTEGEHVIDLPGRLRRAWRLWKFRLFVLTVVIGAAAGAGASRSIGLAGVLGWLSLFLFGCWSVALFRKTGFAQMLLKWLVYGVVLLAGGAAVGNLDASTRPPVFLFVLALALVLTLTKISKWLGGLIRVHVWESEPVRVVRGWFR